MVLSYYLVVVAIFCVDEHELFVTLKVMFFFFAPSQTKQIRAKLKQAKPSRAKLRQAKPSRPMQPRNGTNWICYGFTIDLQCVSHGFAMDLQ